MAIKTEMKTAYISIQQMIMGGRPCSTGPSLHISFAKQESNDCFIHAHLSEVQVAVPVLEESEVEKLLAGAHLEALYDAKEKIQAETQRKLMGIDDLIGQLLAIENKEQ